MKLFSFLFLASLLLFSALGSQTPQESPELAEAISLTEEVVNLFNKGKFDDALPRAKRALEIRERLLPHTDPRVSTSLSYLGDLYLAKRNYKAATPVFERLLQIQTERLGPDDVSAATTVDRLAVLYSCEGSPLKAEEMYKRALTLREKAFGVDDLRVAPAVYALAEFYRGEKQYELSAAHYKRALAINGRLAGIKDPEFERASDGLTCLSYESKSPSLMKDLNEIRKQFAPPTAAPATVERYVLDGKALKLPKPKFPLAAWQRRLSAHAVGPEGAWLSVER